MFQYLEQLRQKPEKAKKRFAFLVAFSISGIIFIVWLSVIYPNFNEQKKIDDKVKGLEPSPLSSFVQNVSYGFGQIGKSFSGIKESVNMFETKPEYYGNSTSTSTSTSTESSSVNNDRIEIYNVSSTTSTSSKTVN